MSRVRGFEVVADEHRVNKYKTPTPEIDNKVMIGGEKFYVPEIKLPVRADQGSSGYDFYAPHDIEILPNQSVLIWTDVKAYMQQDEELKLYVRSSMGVKHGIVLANTVGKVDSSYYGNPKNDGNIGICLLNTSGKAFRIKRGERIVQGSFYKYLTTDDDAPLSMARVGGIGSSGK